MSRDVKLLLNGVLIIVLALLTSVGLALRPVNPDLPSTFADHISPWAGGAALACVWIGSVMIEVSAISLSRRISTLNLVYAGLTFLLTAAIVWGISHIFVITTYAFIPVIVPWMIAILAGGLMLLTAGLRALTGKHRT